MIKKRYILTVLLSLCCVWKVMSNKPPYPQDGELYFELHIDKY